MEKRLWYQRMKEKFMQGEYVQCEWDEATHVKVLEKNWSGNFLPEHYAYPVVPILSRREDTVTLENGGSALVSADKLMLKERIPVKLKTDPNPSRYIDLTGATPEESNTNIQGTRSNDSINSSGIK